MNTSSDESPFGPVVFSYTRAQAIEDGVLVDVSTVAKEAGFKHHTVVSEAVWAMIEPSEELQRKLGCDTQGRLWDVLFMAMFAIRSGQVKDGQPIYEVILPQSARDPDEIVKLKILCHPGDDMEPVLTIMREFED